MLIVHDICKFRLHRSVSRESIVAVARLGDDDDESLHRAVNRRSANLPTQQWLARTYMPAACIVNNSCPSILQSVQYEGLQQPARAVHSL